MVNHGAYAYQFDVAPAFDAYVLVASRALGERVPLAALAALMAVHRMGIDVPIYHVRVLMTWARHVRDVLQRWGYTLRSLPSPVTVWSWIWSSHMFDLFRRLASCDGIFFHGVLSYPPRTLGRGTRGVCS